MKKIFFGITFGLIYFAGFSVPSNSSQVIDSLVNEFRKRDDLENFTYACLDHYLQEPIEARLIIFTHFERKCWRSKKTKEEFLAYVILLCNKGYYLTRFGAVYTAIEAYEKAWKIFSEQQLTGFDITEYGLKPLGNNYSMLGDYSSAENIVKGYLFQSEKEKNEAHTVAAIINLSIIFHDTGRYEQAIKLLSETAASKAIPPVKQGLIYSMLANNYASLQDFHQARKYSTLAVKLFLQFPTEDSPVHLVNSYKMLARIDVHENNLGNALARFKKAQAIASLYSKAFKSRELAKLSLEYSDLLKIMHKHNEARVSYYRALTILLPSFSPGNTEVLPQPTLFYAENAIKETLDGLADLYTKIRQPEKAIACYELSFSVEDLLRNTYNYQHAKLRQQIENRARAEQVIELLFQRYKKTGKIAYGVRAFQVAERTKALTLKESIEDKYAREFIRQDTLFTKERELLFKQSTLSTEITLEQAKQQEASTDYRHQLRTRQTGLAIEIKSIQKTIDEKYPEFSLSGKPSTWIDVDTLQKKLQGDNAVLIEYVAAKDSVFLFIVNSESVTLQKVANQKELNEHVLDFVEMFSNASAINNNIEAYKQLAFTLYRELGLMEVPANKKIILIPDGLLNAIPFDALLCELSSSIHYASLPYLIKKHTIAYQASASVYLNSQRRYSSSNEGGMLAMFPVFENSQQTLAYSMEEAKSIRRFFPEGTYLYHNQATKHAFLKNASAYSMIHLSTHALSGNATDLPAIYFIDSVLYLSQVYGLHLTTDLMVLSACETGVGAIARGEGALSLAHGFQFAGVRNTILSLWKVNDKSTATLFSSFYEHYLEGGSKAAAMQQAKLDYLTNERIDNGQKSPFYWAAFIYYGDFQTQEVENNSFLVTVVVLIGILLIFGYFFYRKIKKK